MFSTIISECEETLGKKPCEYAVIGLGSLARGEATPYSDIEWAIVLEDIVQKTIDKIKSCDAGIVVSEQDAIEVERRNQEEIEKVRIQHEINKKYFRKLAHYAYLKVINLGENILPPLGIKGLNNHESKEKGRDDWFYDSVTPRGFLFDGLMPRACKWPCGNMHLMTIQPQQKFELIGTASELLKYQMPEELKKLEGAAVEHLDNVLASSIHIYGQEALSNHYQKEVTRILKDSYAKLLHVNIPNISRSKDEIEPPLLSSTTLPLGMVKAVHLLRCDLDVYDTDLENYYKSGKLYQIKKDMYRLPETLVEGLALYYNIEAVDSWDKLQELWAKGKICTQTLENFKIILSIATEMRLRTYLSNHGQKENRAMNKCCVWEKN